MVIIMQQVYLGYACCVRRNIITLVSLSDCGDTVCNTMTLNMSVSRAVRLLLVVSYPAVQRPRLRSCTLPRRVVIAKWT